jgi:hypothetical protein
VGFPEGVPRHRLTHGNTLPYKARHRDELELDSRGRVVTQWCFAPQGELAVGDVMLAQKIALETMERTALAAANRRLC